MLPLGQQLQYTWKKAKPRTETTCCSKKKIIMLDEKLSITTTVKKLWTDITHLATAYGPFLFLGKFHSPPLSSLHSYSTPGNLVSAGLLPLEKGLKKKGKFWEVTGSTQEVHCTDMLSNVASTPLMQPAPPREGEEGERCQLFQRKWNFRRSLASQAWQSDCPSSCLSSQPIW